MTNETTPWEELTKRVDLCSNDLIGLATQVRGLNDEVEHLHELLDIAKDGLVNFNTRLAEFEQRLTQHTWADRNHLAEEQTNETKILNILDERLKFAHERMDDISGKLYKLKEKINAQLT